MSILSKPAPAPVPVDGELERLRQENALLKKKSGIDDYKLEEKLILAKQEDERTRLRLEQSEKRLKEDQKRKADRIKEINKKFSDNLDKKIKVFQILSNSDGRWPEVTTNANCPNCGSTDIPVLPEFKSKIVESLEAYQIDPCNLMERNRFNSLGTKEFSCRGCGHHWAWHYQISI